MDATSEPIVQIAENSLQATLILPKEYDRSLLTVDLCVPLIKQAGVHPEAIDLALIEACIQSAKQTEQSRFEGTIAKAKPAVPGVDAYIDWQAQPQATDLTEPDAEQPDPSDEAGASKDDEDDSVSFYSQSIYTVVKVGDILGKVYPEVPGTEGTDVRGKLLPARTAKPLDLKYDETIGVDQDSNLVAKVDGVLIRDRKSARISDTIEVDQNVDFSTGNIDFPGNVLVHRGVKDCFSIVARDDIEVRGLIEAASLIAGKDLHAKGGFAGREQGSAQVEGTLYAKYLDAVKIQVGTDLCVEREIINCDSTVLGNINSPRGSLIGGVTRVTGSVDVLELGASAQPITELHVGVLPHLDPLIVELKQCVEELIQARDELLSEEEMITANSGARIAPSHQVKLNEIRVAMGKLQRQLDRAEPSLERVLERAESLRKVDIKISRKLHPNALLVSAGFRYRVTNELKGPIHITINKRGQLEYQQGEDKPKLLSAESDLRTAA